MKRGTEDVQILPVIWFKRSNFKRKPVRKMCVKKMATQHTVHETTTDTHLHTHSHCVSRMIQNV